MASSNYESIVQNRKRNIILALCRHLSLDPEAFLGNLDNDITSLCKTLLESSQNEALLGNNEEVIKWIGFAERFPVDSGACAKALSEFNEDLITKSVLLGGGLKPSVADITVFSAVHSSVISLSGSDREILPHLVRWMDYIQNKEDFGKLFERILLEKVQFEPPVSKVVKKVETEVNGKSLVQGVKDSNVSTVKLDKKKSQDMASQKKEAGHSQSPAEKKKLPEKLVDDKDKEISASLLKIQVGLVRKAWKHPSADSLLVEEIDIGEAKCRQVVSGLAKYLSPDDLTNRRVVLVTNVKPGKLRDIMSEGLVLCASNTDHTVVEPLRAPEGAKIGECISFSGREGKPEDVLNPKKKQLEKVTPHLFTDDKGVATFKGIPFMTSGGSCTSIPNASIK